MTSYNLSPLKNGEIYKVGEAKDLGALITELKVITRLPKYHKNGECKHINQVWYMVHSSKAPYKISKGISVGLEFYNISCCGDCNVLLDRETQEKFTLKDFKQYIKKASKKDQNILMKEFKKLNL